MSSSARDNSNFQPRFPIDSSGFNSVLEALPRWKPDSTLEEVSAIWQGIGDRSVGRVDEILNNPAVSSGERVQLLVKKATLLNYDGKSEASV